MLSRPSCISRPRGDPGPLLFRQPFRPLSCSLSPGSAAHIRQRLLLSDSDLHGEILGIRLNFAKHNCAVNSGGQEPNVHDRITSAHSSEYCRAPDVCSHPHILAVESGYIVTTFRGSKPLPDAGLAAWSINRNHTKR